MGNEFVDSVFDTWKKNPKALIANFIIVFAVLFTIFLFLYSQQVSTLEKDFQTKKNALDGVLETKDAQIELLETQNSSLKDASIRDGINSGAININLENIGNIDSNFASKIVDASCKEKDFIISELVDKINSQDKGLVICQQDNNSLKSQLDDLQKKIPDYENGFVGKEISVGVNSTFIADESQFTLAVLKTESFASGTVFSFWTEFVLNGVGYRKNVGEKVRFVYFDSNYVLTLIQSGNPSKFSIAKVN